MYECVDIFNTIDQDLNVPTIAWDYPSPLVHLNDVLFFNRIPKTGSENFVSLMFELSRRNGFQHLRFGMPDPKRLDQNAQVGVVYK